jgi:hypothetical protein
MSVKPDSNFENETCLRSGRERNADQLRDHIYHSNTEGQFLFVIMSVLKYYGICIR